MLAEFLTLNIFAFFLIFARIGTIVMLLPGFSATFVSVRVRLVVGLAISFLMTPVLAGNLPGLPPTMLGLSLMLMAEIVIGALIGTIGRVLTGALQTAGTLVALFSSMANALIRDPISEQQSSMVANFFGNVGVLLIFITDMHHLMLQAMVDSYTLFAPGGPLPVGDFAQVLARRVTDSFALGVQLASPFIVVALTYYLGLGILGRLMPALPVFFVGLPIQIALMISVMILTMASIMMAFLEGFREGYSDFLLS